MVEDVFPLPGAGQNCPLPLLLPLTFRLRMISSMVVFAPLLVVRLATQSFLCLLMLLLGLPKHMVTVLPNVCWLGIALCRSPIINSDI